MDARYVKPNRTHSHRFHQMMAAAGVLLLSLVMIGQGDAQDDRQLRFNTPVEGTIESRGQARSWSFFGWSDQMLSFRVEATGSLDPVMTIRGPDGARIIGNDDYAYPDRRGAMLEAITIPRSGEYEVIVSAYGETTGTFSLTMLPGFGQFVLDERFVSQGDWEANSLDSTAVQEGIATLEAEGVAVPGALVNPEVTTPETFYARLLVSDVTGSNGWRAGLVIRYQPNGNHYRLLVNNAGQWRFTAIESGEQRVIQEWEAHPAIPADTTSFSLSVLVNGATFTPFYEGQQLDRVTDDALPASGSIGPALQTTNTIGSEVSLQVDELAVTEPFQRPDGRVFPRELVPGDSGLTVLELTRRGVMPSQGQLAWEIEDSFVETSGPGVSRLPLVEQSSFSAFAMGARVTLQGGEGGTAACGLLFANQDDTHYAVAYLDSSGSYGVSRRVDDDFMPGLYGENDDWDVREGADLVLVSHDDQVHFYVNRVHVGTQSMEVNPGQVGNVVINFDPVSSSCQYQTTWVWSLETDG